MADAPIPANSDELCDYVADAPGPAYCDEPCVNVADAPIPANSLDVLCDDEEYGVDVTDSSTPAGDAREEYLCLKVRMCV